MTELGAQSALPEDGALVPSPPPPASGRRAVGDVLVQAFGRLGNGLLGVVVTVVLARALGAEDLGRWSTILAVVSLATPLTEVGISQVAIGRAAARPAEEAAWLGALIALRSFLAVVLFLATFLAVLLLADGGDMRLAGLLTALTVLLGGLAAYGAVFQLRVRNDLAVLAMTLNSLVWTVGVIVVDVLGGGLVEFAAVFLLAAGCNVTLQVLLARRRAAIAFADVRARSRDLLRVGLPLSIGTVMVVAYGKLDQLLVFGISSERDAGLYAAAYRVLDQTTVIPLSVVTTLYPLLAAAHGRGDTERVRFLLQRALEVLVAVSLGGLAFAVPCGGDVLALLFGDEFRDAGPTLAILMGAFGLICLGYLNGSLVLLHELGRWMLLVSAIGLVVNLALNLTLIGPYGYVAAAWATLATEALVVALTSWVTLRRAAWRPSLGRIARATAAAAVTAGVLAALTAAGVPVLVLLLGFPLLYVGLLAAAGGVRVRETLDLVRPGSRG